MGRVGEHRLCGRPALLRNGPVADETEGGGGRLLGGDLLAADHQGLVGTELAARVDDQPRRIIGLVGRGRVPHQETAVLAEIEDGPGLRGVGAEADQLRRGTVDGDRRDEVRRAEVDP